MYLLQLDLWLILEKFILIGAIVTIALVVAMYSTYAERKVAAFLQDRVGPNRAGPFGILQPVADGLKLFMKEEIIPTVSSKLLFILGPMLAMITAMMTSAVIPWGSTIDIGGRQVPLQIADINIGVLYIFGVVSLGVYGIMIGGWASNNKFSLISSVRGASQMISYELAMGLSLIAVLMIVGSLRMSAIVDYQIQHGWNIIYQPIGFFDLFHLCARRMQPYAVRPSGSGKRTELRVPPGIFVHEAWLLPVCRIHQHVHQQRGDGYAFLRRL
jgi:NADH-quinone oxidoreductase subunit H